MMTHTPLFRRLVVPFVFGSLRLSAMDVSPVALRYPIGDQHDTLSILLQDTITERNVHRLESESRIVRHASMVKSSGAVPGESILAIENEIAQDALTAPSDDHHVKSFEAKLRGLKALLANQEKEFQVADRESNRELLAHFELERRKAELEVKYAAERYERIHGSHLAGASAWARDQEALLTRKKAEAMLDGWKRKVVEQTRQTGTAERELRQESNAKH